MAQTNVVVRPLKNRIERIGIELEGAWLEKHPPLPVVRDGSVEIPPPKQKRMPSFSTQTEMNDWTLKERVRLAKVTPVDIGEITTGNNGIPNTEEAIDQFLFPNYPQVVNATCGLHVHMSTTQMNYQRLMDPDLTKVMVEGLKKWAEREELPQDHPLWPRLNQPDHRHCAHTYCGDEQVKQTGKDFNSRGKPHSRYTAINYCFGQHKTVEVRLLSMFDTPEQAKRAILEVIKITNRFLSKVRRKELTLTGKVTRRPVSSRFSRIAIR